MRQIDLTKYTTPVKLPDGSERQQEYDVRESLIMLLFVRSQQLNARQLLERDDVARKIRDHQGDTILLEDSEYAQAEGAINSFAGFGQEDVAFVKRVLEAEKVDGRDLKIVKKDGSHA